MAWLFLFSMDVSAGGCGCYCAYDDGYSDCLDRSCNTSCFGGFYGPGGQDTCVVGGTYFTELGCGAGNCASSGGSCGESTCFNSGACPYCYNTYNGDWCRIDCADGDEWLCSNSGATASFTGVVDYSGDQKCVQCNGKIEDRVLGVSGAVYCGGDYGSFRDGDDECESACGAPSSLDETPSGFSDLRNVSYPGNATVGQSFTISFQFKKTGSSKPYTNVTLERADGSQVTCLGDASSSACTWVSYSFSASCYQPGTNTFYLKTAGTTSTAQCGSADVTQQITLFCQCPAGQVACGNQCVTPGCTNDGQCGDGNPCTSDVCNNPGQCTGTCSHNNVANGTVCGTTNCSGCGSDPNCAWVGSCNRTCQNGSCQNCTPACSNQNCCNDSDSSCGNCGNCQNCNNSDNWYNVGGSYSCCSGDSRCTCQDQQYRDYYCSGGSSCNYNVNGTQTATSGCTSCSNQDGWYNVGGAYTCCNPDGLSRCTACQNQEYRDYYCQGSGSCNYTVTNNQVLYNSCSSCGQFTCPNDKCDPGPTYVDYPPTCNNTCSGGACQSCGTSCTPENTECTAGGCCVKQCSAASGCYTTNGADDCSNVNLLKVNCVGCGAAHATGDYTVYNECNDSVHDQNFKQACGGTNYYCCPNSGDDQTQWKWRVTTCAKPKAVFEFKNPVDGKGHQKTVFVFNPSASSDSDGSVSKYQWDCGDDGVFEKECLSATDDACNRCNEAGLYKLPAGTTTEDHVVWLRVKDNQGWLSDPVSRTVTVTNVPPVAGFGLSPETAHVGDGVALTDSSSDVDDDIVKWEWDYGDDRPLIFGQVPSPMPRFGVWGKYSITLTVTDEVGESGSVSMDFVATNEHPNARVKVGSCNPVSPEPVGERRSTCDPVYEDSTLVFEDDGSTDVDHLSVQEWLFSCPDSNHQNGVDSNETLLDKKFECMWNVSGYHSGFLRVKDHDWNGSANVFGGFFRDSNDNNGLGEDSERVYVDLRLDARITSFVASTDPLTGLSFCEAWRAESLWSDTFGLGEKVCFVDASYDDDSNVSWEDPNVVGDVNVDSREQEWAWDPAAPPLDLDDPLASDKALVDHVFPTGGDHRIRLKVHQNVVNDGIEPEDDVNTIVIHSAVCGNGVCEVSETNLTCPQDCWCGDVGGERSECQTNYGGYNPQTPFCCGGEQSGEGDVFPTCESDCGALGACNNHEDCLLQHPTDPPGSWSCCHSPDSGESVNVCVELDVGENCCGDVVCDSDGDAEYGPESCRNCRLDCGSCSCTEDLTETDCCKNDRCADEVCVWCGVGAESGVCYPGQDPFCNTDPGYVGEYGVSFPARSCVNPGVCEVEGDPGCCQAGEQGCDSCLGAPLCVFLGCGCSVTKCEFEAGVQSGERLVGEDLVNVPPLECPGVDCVGVTSRDDVLVRVLDNGRCNSSSSRYVFDWGDGVVQVEGAGGSVNRHRFDRLGEFNVKVSVEDAFSEGLELNCVRVDVSENPAPVAVLVVSPGTGGDVLTEFSFDVLQSFDPNGSVSQFRLDYGDGLSSGWLPFTGNPARHLYEGSGSYEVVLTVEDDAGKQSTTSKKIFVGEEVAVQQKLATAPEMPLALVVLVLLTLVLVLFRKEK
ncbi:MAG TPA: PKD domain-containing protein [archaeon]|nr:PKD domain-containing protein [archaeon]